MRSGIDRLMDTIQFIPVDHGASDHDDRPYATHEGWLEIEGQCLHVYQLNTGVRVIDAASLQQFFRWLAAEPLEG